MESQKKDAHGVQEEDKQSRDVRGDIRGSSSTGNNDGRKDEKSKSEEVKRLPHQQVPQPSDFNTQALEQL